MPATVVTVIAPVVAPAGTAAIICSGETTVKDAATPLNCTSVAPVKLAPLMVTSVPTGPLPGLKLLMRGAAVKLATLADVPAPVVTLIGPERAVAGICAVICVAEFTVNVAAAPLKLTAVAPVKPEPTNTTLPVAPPDGLKPAITGAVGEVTVKFPVLVPVPVGMVTLILPVVAPVGTLAVICVGELIIKPLPKAPALTPLKATAVAPVKLAPVMVTTVPTGPLVGVNDVIVGLAATVKLPALVAVPPAVVTLILPVVAPAGTVVVICVGALTVKVALTLLNFTEVAPVKLMPLIITVVPTPPDTGLKL